MDVQIHNEGSMIGFRPMSEAAQAWFDENVASESWQWLGNVLAAIGWLRRRR